ncbi:MAG: YfhO family protein [Lachnospiraceae bacterium]|nr:YfhO family protein [Lachnospiraceae bacterium]
MLVKNEDVLPVCYGTVNLLSEDEYGQLDFPETLEKLGSRAVVPDNGTNILADGAGKDGKSADIESGNTGNKASCVKAMDADEFFKPSEKDKLLNPSGKKESYVMELTKTISDRILIIRFHVESSDGKAVEIRINGIKNKLSAKSAPYPNRNNDFTYIISAEKPLNQLNVDVSEGSYKVEGLCVYALDKKSLHQDIVKPESDKSRSEDGRNVYKGQITMDSAGYFITSYPYRKGYSVEIDGQTVNACRVNTAFVGFPIEEGRHSIEITYEAPGFRAGLIISALSFIIGLFLLITFHRKSIFCTS